MQRENIPESLLADVKNYLNITWDDEATDAKMSGLIAAGSVYLDLKYGGEADYVEDGLPRTLLMEYVRYARDGALDVFENNDQPLVIGMQNQKAVSEYVPAVEGTVSSRYPGHPELQRRCCNHLFCGGRCASWIPART